MGEQKTAIGEQENQNSTCSHLEAVGKRWGDFISAERQAELQALLDTWNMPNIGQNTRRGPFTGRVLTGADVFWLANRVRVGDKSSFGLHLEGAILLSAHLEGALLDEAHLAGVSLLHAQLDDADLANAHLEGAQLSEAHLVGADLRGAHLEGADLSYARMENASLAQCWLTSTSILRGTSFDSRTELGDIHWSGLGAVDLTQIVWERVPTLGDEVGIKPKSHPNLHEDSVRAYRQLAAQLRAQGMNEVADRFAYRAQVRQLHAYVGSLLHDWRNPFRWLENLGRTAVSLFLAVLAGFGYRPGLTFLWYVVTVVGFAQGYLLLTHGVPLFGLSEPPGTQPLHWYEALVFSVTSFHGRGFFPQGIGIGDPVAILAASEAVIGLFIEISFIATFTQRYFAR